jgi:hypothetical protein
MPDNFCPKLRYDSENLECLVYCGIEGTGFPCTQSDNSDCGKYYQPKSLKEKNEVRFPEYITDY